MKTAKEILHEHATKNEDGFTSGQVKWIVEAMEEYANQFKHCENPKEKTVNFYAELLELINRHVDAGLKKADLVNKMEYATQSCRVS